jgi:hypothetical protein
MTSNMNCDDLLLASPTVCPAVHSGTWHHWTPDSTHYSPGGMCWIAKSIFTGYKEDVQPWRSTHQSLMMETRWSTKWILTPYQHRWLPEKTSQHSHYKSLKSYRDKAFYGSCQAMLSNDLQVRNVLPMFVLKMPPQEPKKNSVCGFWLHDVHKTM